MLRWAEHFGKMDYAALTKKYTGVCVASRISFVSGRGGRPGLRIQVPGTTDTSSGLYSGLSTSHTELYAGLAFKMSEPTLMRERYPIVGFWDDIYPNGGIWVSNQGQLQMRRENYSETWNADATLAIGPYINWDVWHFLELYINYTTSSFSFRLDTRQAVSGAGEMRALNFNGTPLSNLWATAVVLCQRMFGSNQPPDAVTYSDFYIVTKEPGRYLGWLGDVRIAPRMPISNHAVAWAPNGAVQNWDCVEETPPSSAEYVSSSIPGQQDLYNFEPITFSGRVLGVMETTFGSKSDGGPRDIKHLCKSGVTIAASSAIALQESGSCQTSIWEEDPATANEWTTAGLDAAKFGQELV